MAMWPSWVKTRASRSKSSPSTALVAAAATTRRFSIASHSPSLKDIPSLVRPEHPRPPRVFHRLRVAASALRLLRALKSASAHATAREPEVHVVLYSTSLRVVRRTYEDCYTVRFILRGIGATVDERDLAVDNAFVAEFAALLPPRLGLALPQVFVDGRHLGGVEEVQRLHECGELNRIVAAPTISSAPAHPPCGRCGDERHVPCGSCDGSRKKHSDDGSRKKQSDDEDGALTCAACNASGLVRCPDCLFPAAA
ncbi:uncharacterized protein At5g39865-like [Triticum dicoccoides]|uniref:uncharacterized protein At5g39865-like n=1 Tax=Triticum dicoccoides TaxID=85692 RepID=UPI00162F24A7|nr:uncharacterized protein At5g39865-like [Triticum dicoccoides]